MIVAGLGCRSGASHQEIETAIALALAQHDVSWTTIDAFATVRKRASEPGIARFASLLKVPLLVFEPQEIDAIAHRVETRTARVGLAVPAASVSEATALLGAGRNARLLGPRMKTRVATAALAIGDGA